MYGLGDFMQSLPLSLKYKLADSIHKDVIDKFEFFMKVQEKSFLSWVGHRLLPRLVCSRQYLYQETDEMQGFYFIKEGEVAFVLASFDNAIYQRRKEGSMLGFEDYIYHFHQAGLSVESLHIIEANKSQFLRKFTVITTNKVEALELPTAEVMKMGAEFPSVQK